MELLQARKKTDLIVVHCSATGPGMDWGRAEIDRSHRQRGFVMIGYHFVIKRDGTVEIGRPQGVIGAHAEGFNAISVAVCMVGGISITGKDENNFTPAQWKSLHVQLSTLRRAYPSARILGHRDLSPDRNKDGVIQPRERVKECPSFDVAEFVKTYGL
ncbi:N-acetylmuramoyl-L-alanine amidase [Phenylobacterium sp.]|uniref:N-acetylmuramoyl-L-alanine amidase n=1 Tax=Phenylobacterium sp. TaxID=1871053 RepID=UPI002737D996|nr:N-acetylmuramoyl-L-alanine amidase [Phenylobacterium sp.]MDP3869904.1 N-acetylmuramoyl-L-alanine amidase [Phenylobacterium sp.]